MSESTRVTTIPLCNLCTEASIPAAYDGKTIYGSWANMCEDHMASHGSGLGMGRGQRLILIGSDADPGERDRHADAQAALEAGDWDALEDAVGDGDLLDFI